MYYDKYIFTLDKNQGSKIFILVNLQKVQGQHYSIISDDDFSFRLVGCCNT